MNPARPIVLDRGDGPPVLLIHGLAGFKESWGGLPDAIAAAGMRAVAVDLPGSSAPAPAGACDAVAHSVALAPLLDELGPGAAVVGHSLGAQVALHLARARPGAVRRLALVAPVVVPRPAVLLRPPHGIMELLLVPGVGRPLARLAIALARRDPARRRRAILVVAGRRRVPEAGSVQAALLEDAAARLAVADLRCFTDWAATGLRRGALDAAAAVDVPAMIVAGALDPLVPRGHLARLTAALARPRSIMVHGAGHFPHLEAPAGVMSALVAHLRGGAASSAP